MNPTLTDYNTDTSLPALNVYNNKGVQRKNENLILMKNYIEM